MKILLLCHDLTNNALGRAYILAQMLQQEYEVSITGPLPKGESIWAPLENSTDIPIIPMNGSVIGMLNQLRQTDADVLYAIKPRGRSYGYALITGFLRNLPVVLDEDDWDEKLHVDIQDKITPRSPSELGNSNSSIYTRLLSRMTNMATAVTVSSPFLQRLFGGTVIPHARNMSLFTIPEETRSQLQQKYNPENKTVVMFLGTVRKHKGIDFLIDICDKMDRDDFRLIIAGVDAEAASVIPVRDYIRTIPPLPFERAGEYLSIADIVVLPQRNTPFAKGQTPAKLFDAMAAGSCVIASKIGWIPEVLDGCGYTFNPDDPESLQTILESCLDNPRQMRILGIKAQEKCKKHYSYESVSTVLNSIFRPFNQV